MLHLPIRILGFCLASSQTVQILLRGYPVISLNTLKIVMGRETHLIADFLDRVFAAFQRFRPASIRT